MVNFKKLKKAMDADGDFLIDRIISPDDQDPFEEIVMIRTGVDGESDYRISVEKHIDGEDNYNVISEFGSDLNEVENAVNCYIDNGGSIEDFDSYKE